MAKFAEKSLVTIVMGEVMAKAQLEDQKKTIADYLLKEEQVATGQFPRDEIFEIQVESKIIGPFWQEDLKEFLSDANLYSESTQVKSLEEGDWKSVYNHPYFQRRRPSLVSSEGMTNVEEVFYLLKDGQKNGPFQKEKLQTMVDSMELLLNDFVSIDEGQSWGKLYEVDGFDRRTKNHENLPHKPEGHVFDNSVYDADKALAQADIISEETDAIVGLAYIGHLNEGKRKVHIEETSNTNRSFNEQSEESPSGLKNIALISVLSLSLIGSVYFAYEIMSGSPAPIKKEKNVAKREVTNNVKRAPAKKRQRVKAAKKKARPFKVVTGKQVTRSSESIKKAEFLKSKSMTSGAIIREVPPEAIFDDANEAVELDPIRSRVSRDVLNPRDDFDSELSDEELQDFSRNLGPVDEDGNPIDAELEEE